MEIIRKLTGRQIDLEVFNSRIGQIVCFSAGFVILVLGIFKLSRLELTEAASFFGLMLTLSVTLLCVALGQLIHIAEAMKNKKTFKDESSSFSPAGTPQNSNSCPAHG